MLIVSLNIWLSLYFVFDKFSRKITRWINNFSSSIQLSTFPSLINELYEPFRDRSPVELKQLLFGSIKTWLNRRFQLSESTSCRNCWWSSSIPSVSPRLERPSCRMCSCTAHSVASEASIAVWGLGRVSCLKCWSSVPPWASSDLLHRCFARGNSVNEEKREMLAQR